jgi:UPF0755 protein
VNFRIGVAKSDVVLRELDPATNSFVEVVKFDAGHDAAAAGISEPPPSPTCAIASPWPRA